MVSFPKRDRSSKEHPMTATICMNMTYIYALSDPRTNAIRYVGKSNDPDRRLQDHIVQAPRNKYRTARWVNSLIQQGLVPGIEILEEVVDSEWQVSERKWILLCRAQGCDLTNHTDGGEGVHNPDKEARERLSKSRRALFQKPGFRKKMRLVYQDPKRCAKISHALVGKPKSKEHIARLPQNNPGWHHTEEAKAKIRAGCRGRGHRWTSEEATMIAKRNKENWYGIGNKSRTGQTRSKEELAKVSKALKGRRKTEEHKEKIRKGLLTYWASEKGRERQHGFLSKSL